MNGTKDEVLSAVNEASLPAIDDVRRLIPVLLGQMRWARRYTMQLLEATPHELWYQTPPEHRSNVAWQVGHLAVSQYGLLMFRIRGREPGDLDLIPGRFRKTFGRGGTPPEHADGMPSPEELLEKLGDIDRLALSTVQSTAAEVWLEPVEMPYAVYPCKLGAALFFPLHEALHAGQIGGLRRGLGLEPVR